MITHNNFNYTYLNLTQIKLCDISSIMEYFIEEEWDLIITHLKERRPKEAFEILDSIACKEDYHIGCSRYYILLKNQPNIKSKYGIRRKEKKYISPAWWINPYQTRIIKLIPKKYYSTPATLGEGRSSIYSNEWSVVGNKKYEKRIISEIISSIYNILRYKSMYYKPVLFELRGSLYKYSTEKSFIHFLISMYCSWKRGLLKEYEK